MLAEGLRNCSVIETLSVLILVLHIFIKRNRSDSYYNSLICILDIFILPLLQYPFVESCSQMFFCCELGIS